MSKWLVAMTVFTMACSSSPKEKIPERDAAPPPSHKYVIYQLLPRLFGNTTQYNKYYGSATENGVGKFNQINTAALKGIKALGATHVWYTGVIEHASLTAYPGHGITADHPRIVKGRAGSPYAIRDYYDVDADLAEDVGRRMQEFEALVVRTHQAGLQVIIDFVPNHVARSYRSDSRPPGVEDFGAHDDDSVAFKPSNNFYYLPGKRFYPPASPMMRQVDSTLQWGSAFHEMPAKVTGNNEFTNSPGPNDWYETVKLNYGVDIQANGATYFDPIPDTWRKMLHILLFWVGKGVDGFRCDMAEMVPDAFWKWVIPQVKSKNPKLIFIAEIYTPAKFESYLNDVGFDFLYDKVNLYDALYATLTNSDKTVRAVEDAYRALQGINHRLLHFMENHDEQRLASPRVLGNATHLFPAMVVSVLIDRSPVLVYFGQEVGEPALGREGYSGDDGRTTIHDYWGVPELQKWINGGAYDGGLLSLEQQALRQHYQTLLMFGKNQLAITAGGMEMLPTASSKVFAFMRFFQNDFTLVIANLGGAEEKIDIDITPEQAQKMRLTQGSISYVGKDIFTQADIVIEEGKRLRYAILPYQSIAVPLSESCLNLVALRLHKAEKRSSSHTVKENNE